MKTLSLLLGVLLWLTVLIWGTILCLGAVIDVYGLAGAIGGVAVLPATLLVVPIYLAVTDVSALPGIVVYGGTLLGSILFVFGWE